MENTKKENEIKSKREQLVSWGLHKSIDNNKKYPKDSPSGLPTLIAFSLHGVGVDFPCNIKSENRPFEKKHKKKTKYLNRGLRFTTRSAIPYRSTAFSLLLFVLWISMVTFNYSSQYQTKLPELIHTITHICVPHFAALAQGAVPFLF